MSLLWPGFWEGWVVKFMARIKLGQICLTNLARNPYGFDPGLPDWSVTHMGLIRVCPIGSKSLFNF